MNRVLELILESKLMVDGDRVRIRLGGRLMKLVRLFPDKVTRIWFTCGEAQIPLLQLINGRDNIDASFFVWSGGTTIFVRFPYDKVVYISLSLENRSEGRLELKVTGDKVTITDATTAVPAPCS